MAGRYISSHIFALVSVLTAVPVSLVLAGEWQGTLDGGEPSVFQSHNLPGGAKGRFRTGAVNGWTDCNPGSDIISDHDDPYWVMSGRGEVMHGPPAYGTFGASRLVPLRPDIDIVVTPSGEIGRPS